MKICNYWIETYGVRFNNKSWTETWEPKSCCEIFHPGS